MRTCLELVNAHQPFSKGSLARIYVLSPAAASSQAVSERAFVSHIVHLSSAQRYEYLCIALPSLKKFTISRENKVATETRKVVAIRL